MKILGIDPGLQVCGYACVEAASGQENLIEAGVIRTVRSESLEEKLNRIAEDITTLLKSFGPAVVAIKSFSATRIKKSLTGNGRASKEQVQRAIKTVLALRDLPEPNDVADA